MNDPQAPPPKRRGCFFYGCIISSALLLFIAVVVTIVVTSLVRTVNGYIAEYTEPTPMALPHADVPADELKKLNDRLADFNNAVTAHSNVPPLILTGPEINALLATSQQARNLKVNDKFFVTLEGEQVLGQVSMPLDQIKFPFIKTSGRYLNGNGAFRVGVTNGLASVVIDSLTVKGKPLPNTAMAKLRQVNFADTFNANPTNAAAISRFESVTVSNSTMIIQPRQN